MSIGKRKRTSSMVLSTALALVALIFGAPFVWIAVLSLSGGGQATWRPAEWTLGHYRELSDIMDTGLLLRNSLIVAVGSMVVSTTLASLAGYGFSRSRRRSAELIVYCLVLLYAIPLAATMVAIYDLAGRLDLIDTWRGLILAQSAIATPFLTWLLKRFYDNLPLVLDDAAALDGSGVLRIWWQILTPLTLPGILVAAGLSFVLAWSDVLLPTILIADPDMNTIARQFFATANSSDVSQVAALGVLYLAPVLGVMLILRTLLHATISTPDDL